MNKETPTPKTNSMVLRFGANIFRRLSRNQQARHVLDDVHVLNPEEQRNLGMIERQAVLRGAAIGTFAAIICAFSWPVAELLLGPAQVDATFSDLWAHYLVMCGMFTIATVIEIVLLYWNTLVAVHRMAGAAGLELFADDGEPQAVLNALVGAALELPNSREETLFAQPGREVSRWWIITVSILYRLKVTFTYYIAKALLQRFLGRVLVRWAIELIAIPIYAFWDAAVTYWVLRQARVCAMGPSAVKALSQELQQQTPTLGERGRLALLCAVGSTVARNSHLHPNVELFLNELVNIYGTPDQTQIDDSGNLLELLPQLDDKEKRLVIQTVTLSMIIDGKASIWERKLLQQCLEACQIQPDLAPLHRGLERFRSGQSLELEALLPRTNTA